MSWFKRGHERKPLHSVMQSQSNTDPITKLDVFRNHWKQAWTVISCQDIKTVTMNGQTTVDGVETVLHNLEQMINLLISEDANGRLPGPILLCILQLEIFEKFCAWCTINISAHKRLRMQELLLFELVISQSKQMMLIHKPVMKPLLRLLLDVADSQDTLNGDLEFRLVLVLHQICICISQQNLILESFFSTDSDNGPARFLIFSLLIPYIHREGCVGQKARDALLLIMTLSARHPHIGQYIANNSDFCPVLATGLSGLFSSLPRRIIPQSSDWYAITDEDCMRIPDIQMFLNSLQFSNAVVQVAHPLVRNQLIAFIYSGFLVPVLAPALHQDIPGLPVPLLDTDLFRISREEVVTATAYLDLFIRNVTDPHLLKAVLRFVLMEKYDDVLILDSLLSRISSNSLLSTVTLALFHTLINLNCEDVMFQLVFRYLVPCTHVMVSQRRSIHDVDLYSKSAEKLLSLRPACCTQGHIQSTPVIPFSAHSPYPAGVNKSFPKHRLPKSTISTITDSAHSLGSMSLEAVASPHQQETSYIEYLRDARYKLEKTARTCRHWSYLYDGENPTSYSIATADKLKSFAENARNERLQRSARGKSLESAGKPTSFKFNSNLTNSRLEDKNEINYKGSSENLVNFNQKSRDINMNDSLFLPRKLCNNQFRREQRKMLDPKLVASLESLDSFLEYLNEVDLHNDENYKQNNNQTIDEYITALDNFLKSISAEYSQRDIKHIASNENIETNVNSKNALLLSSAAEDIKQLSSLNQSEVSDPSNFTRSSRVAFEETNMSKQSTKSTFPMQKNMTDQKAFRCVDITRVPNKSIDHLLGKSDQQHKEKTVNIAQAADISPSTTFPAKIKTEHIVPKIFSANSESSLNPLYTLSATMKFPNDLLTSFRPRPSSAIDVSVTDPLSLELTKLKYLNDPPNIGPFLSALLARLEGMIGNSLFFNLLLTDVLSRLAAYPQPLLRSLLFSHNLVFQPSIKSFIQVLSSLRQKLDGFSLTVKHFDSLVISARQNLAQREDKLIQLKQEMLGNRSDSVHHSSKSGTEAIKTGRKKVTLSDLIFRHFPGKDKVPSNKKKKQTQPQHVQEVGGGSMYVTRDNILDSQNSLHPLSTWNAVYSALILDEFLQELAALSQEHSVLHRHEKIC